MIAHRDSSVRREFERSLTVTHTIHQSGYSLNEQFTAKSDTGLGMRPTIYRAEGATAEIRFATGQCSLGAILVARSDQGVCAILLGDDAEVLVRDLEERFPRAELISGGAEFEELVAKVVGFIEAPGLALELPLDVQGTAFQQRVWQALREIPAGQTATYREIAGRIGAPGAVRAVAGACAANPLAVAIPCHRVVRTDGSLSGYRWGVERKQALLEREKGS
jgi:AraC family transcriptional regulator of adaptative response/methylated-DNA-[protein]-cysteine methyltransferase